MRKTIVFMLLAFFAGMNLVSATTVYVNPSNIEDSSLVVGDQFTIDIKIDDVSNLYGFDFKLKFDPNVISAVSGSSLFLNENTMKLKNELNNEMGIVQFAIASLYPAVPKSGSGTLATITFQVKAIGESNLDIHDTLLADSYVNSISHETGDGYFNNIPPPTTTVPIPTTTVPRPPKPRGLLSTISSFFSSLFRF